MAVRWCEPIAPPFLRARWVMARRGDEYTCLNVDEITAATSGALRLQIGDYEDWFPRSQIMDGENYEKGEMNLQIEVKTWLAKDRGLVD